MHRSDWPELFGMARTKESAQRYQTTLSAAILLAEVVGWERDYVLARQTREVYCWGQLSPAAGSLVPSPIFGRHFIAGAKDDFRACNKMEAGSGAPAYETSQLDSFTKHPLHPTSPFRLAGAYKIKDLGSSSRLFKPIHFRKLSSGGNLIKKNGRQIRVSRKFSCVLVNTSSDLTIAT